MENALQITEILVLASPRAISSPTPFLLLSGMSFKNTMESMSMESANGSKNGNLQSSVIVA
jgi:hypothetical protein